MADTYKTTQGHYLYLVEDMYLVENMYLVAKFTKLRILYKCLVNKSVPNVNNPYFYIILITKILALKLTPLHCISEHKLKCEKAD